MPSPNPTARRQYAGAAVATTLNGSIVSGAGSFVIVSNAGWPTGAVGNFIVTIDRGLATEERIKCSAQSAGTVTVAASGRGFDSTTAQAHANGATVECTLSAFDADEWNQHTNATSGVHGVAGAVVGTTDVQSLTNKTLDAASTLGGVSGTSLAADRTAWTTWSVAGWTNITIGNSSITASYKQVGKTVFFRIFFIGGSTSSTAGSIIQWAPPVTASASGDQWFAANGFNNASRFAGVGRILAASNLMEIWLPTSTANCAVIQWTGAMGGVAYASGFQFAMQGSYEAA